MFSPSHLVSAAVLSFLLLSGCSQPAPPPTRDESLGKIGEALHNYHDEKSCFPFVNGAPKGEEGHGLSWRVHLLPYLGESELYRQFHLDEPWDGPSNKKLIASMPHVYRVAGVKTEGHTSLRVISGTFTLPKRLGGAEKHFPFEPDRKLRFRDILDGTSNTIAVVVTDSDKAVPWTQPDGLEVDQDALWESFGGPDRLSVLFFDGEIRHLRSGLDPGLLLPALGHDDGLRLDAPAQ